MHCATYDDSSNGLVDRSNFASDCRHCFSCFQPWKDIGWQSIVEMLSNYTVWICACGRTNSVYVYRVFLMNRGTRYKNCIDLQSAFRGILRNSIASQKFLL